MEKHGKVILKCQNLGWSSLPRRRLMNFTKAMPMKLVST
jgi:hypothetical protein